MEKVKPATKNMFICLYTSPSVHGTSQARITGVGCHFLLWKISLTQGLNLHLLHWQVDFLLSHLGNPIKISTDGQLSSSHFLLFLTLL